MGSMESEHPVTTARATGIDSAAGEPWSQHPALPRVFLLDYRSALERQILERWVANSREAAGTTAALHVLAPIGAPAQQDTDTLGGLLDSGQDCFFVPLRVLWREPPGGTSASSLLKRLFGGDPRAPRRLRQRLIHWRNPERAGVLAAPGATLAEMGATLKQRSGGAMPDAGALARFIRRQAVLALEKAERNRRGARYKVPKLLEEEVLSKPRVITALADEAERSGRTLQDLMAEARACLREMAPQHTSFALDIMAALGRYLYTRGFDRQIDYRQEDLDRVRALSAQHPIAFLMTHKSHLDGFLLVTMFYDLDMPPVHIFGGINMSFFGLGALGKRSGAIFIRRSMSGDNVYKAVFKQYIDYLAEKRFPLLWALEGTRSRTGKLMPPRYGLINYVVDSYLRAASTDMILMPIAIAYDQVPEVGDYIAEQKGIAKRPESASWFMQYISGLRNPFGRIHVRFGAGVKLSEIFGEPQPGQQASALDVQKIAFRLAVDANNATPVLGTSLITFVLSAAGGKALTLSELVSELRALARLVRVLELPTTGDVSYASMESLQRVLGQLVHTGVLVRHDGGHEPLYAIAADATVAAAYYRNAALHFLVIGAIAELALALIGQDNHPNAIGLLHAEALRIRDVLKFEFFFHEKTRFIEELEHNLDRRAPHWREALATDGAVFELLRGMHPLLAPGALRPFLESYLVVAEAIALQPQENDHKSLLRYCMRLASQRALQHRITSEESAAKAYLENGLLLAQARGLLKPGCDDVARQEFLAEMRSLVRRTGFIAALIENRRPDAADAAH
jgi:glycerol-3-phosphate O-acyltransferase